MFSLNTAHPAILIHARLQCWILVLHLSKLEPPQWNTAYIWILGIFTNMLAHNYLHQIFPNTHISMKFCRNINVYNLQEVTMPSEWFPVEGSGVVCSGSSIYWNSQELLSDGKSLSKLNNSPGTFINHLYFKTNYIKSTFTPLCTIIIHLQSHIFFQWTTKIQLTFYDSISQSTIKSM